MTDLFNDITKDPSDIIPTWKHYVLLTLLVVPLSLLALAIGGN